MDVRKEYEAILATAATETEKGTRFEMLVRDYLLASAKYQFSKVWLWKDYPDKATTSTTDIGSDLVAECDNGERWLVQCKCYAKTTNIAMHDVTSFCDMVRLPFKGGLFVTTYSNFTADSLKHLSIAGAEIVTLSDMESDVIVPCDNKGGLLRTVKLRDYQSLAVDAASKYYAAEGNDRGMLVMACGTGKTLTSLGIMLKLVPAGTGGLVLYLVPSIGLLAQSQEVWLKEAPLVADPTRAGEKTRCIRVECICSRNDASQEEDAPREDPPLGATTDPEELVKRIRRLRTNLPNFTIVLFATYQSIDVVIEAQRRLTQAGERSQFDLAICDEAHRTTGAVLSGINDKGRELLSDFVKVHDNDRINISRRLYMTATPKVYKTSDVSNHANMVAAKTSNYEVSSMGDVKRFGSTFYRYSFGQAVSDGVLCDYSVVALTVSEAQLTAQEREDCLAKLQIDASYMAKLKGILMALNKRMYSLQGQPVDLGKEPMHRVLVYCNKIGSTTVKESSKSMAEKLFGVRYTMQGEEDLLPITCEHVDGTMSPTERKVILDKLRQEKTGCYCVSNVRCLTEGIDVPALDGVVFMADKRSPFEIVQAVGRVLRQAPDKTRGFVVVPVFLTEGLDPDKLEQGPFANLINVVQAMRSHDERFDALIQKALLDKKLPDNIVISTTTSKAKVDNNVSKQVVKFDYGALSQPICAVILEKCGSKFYWAHWAAKCGNIALTYSARIRQLIADRDDVREQFHSFVAALQDSINPSIDEAQAVELLTQHLITAPVFRTLFPNYHFESNNSVSCGMERMAAELNAHGGFDQQTKDELEGFFRWLRLTTENGDSLKGESKQTIIKNLYENFFQVAFPDVVAKLGIVYTPVECVDFILRSVDGLLDRHFGCNLTDEGVHVLDPFAGTGTFMARLLQLASLIKAKDRLRKYREELHCNEIVLLAYYIADVNIESVFNDARPAGAPYEDYNGICLTDTFQITERHVAPQGRLHFAGESYLEGNREEIEAQRRQAIQVIVGNPPYSVGQRSANDNAQNQKYPHLDARVESTYARLSTANNKNSLYDSYIRAFRWASDRVIGGHDEVSNAAGGIVAFISNGAWIDSNSADGMRATLRKEFDHIYVVNLRGNQRTQGELSRREGGKIFGSGSRTPIAITFLVRLPEGRHSDEEGAHIHYHDIGDYLKTDEKLARLKAQKSVTNVDEGAWQWQDITPNGKEDWINQRNSDFDTLVPLAPEKKFAEGKAVFVTCSNGLKTNRDGWNYNYSLQKVRESAAMQIGFFNEQAAALKAGTIQEVERKQNKISWDAQNLTDVVKGLQYNVSDCEYRTALYRPFNKQNTLYYKPLINRTYQLPRLFPTPEHKNQVICVTSGNKADLPLITDQMPDLHLNGDCQCFPLYHYRERVDALGQGTGEYERYPGVTDWFKGQIQQCTGSLMVTDEDAFHYVYAVLHSRDYRDTYADELRKALPRIPLPVSAEMWQHYVSAGRKLADLHLHYERVDPYPIAYDPGASTQVMRMRYGKLAKPKPGLSGQAATTDYTTIIVNEQLTLRGLPEEAQQYVVNGRSPLSWLIERYQTTTDAKSLIVNDPNDWGREHGEPDYVVKLLLRLVTVSLETLKIVNNLPPLRGEE